MTNIITENRPQILAFASNSICFSYKLELTYRLDALYSCDVEVNIENISDPIFFVSYLYLEEIKKVDDVSIYVYRISFDISPYVSSYIQEIEIQSGAISVYKAVYVDLSLRLDLKDIESVTERVYLVPGFMPNLSEVKDVMSCRMVGDKLCYLSSELQTSQLFVCNLQSDNSLDLKIGENKVRGVPPFSQHPFYYLVDVTALDFGDNDRCYLNLGDNAVCEIIVKEATSICSVLFKSRIGAMERFALLGHAKSVPSFSEESKYLSYQDGIYVPKKQIIPYQQKVEIHTGFLNSVRYSLLLEALVASEVYFCFLDGSEEVRIPVYIYVKEPSFSYRGNDLQGYKIEVEFPKDLAPYQLSKLESFLMTELSEFMTTENNINIIL